MTNSVLHVEDSDFALATARMLASVPSARARVLRVYVHARAGQPALSDVVAAATAYAQDLGLLPKEIRFFHRISRAEARSACINIAEYELVMQERQMPHNTAVALADAWIDKFDERAAFVTNGLGILLEPPSADGASELFQTDLDLGVMAVSPARMGLFWNAENS